MSTVSHPIGIGNFVAFPNFTEEFDLDTDGHETKAVYESPSADAATDHLINVGTLVASRAERDDSEYTERVPVDAHNQSGTYAHDDVRKAVAKDR